MTPNLSIVIPHYNYCHFLPSCLDSILSQSYKDYEIIVVDDGSTDDAASILRHYGLAYPHFRYILSPKNEGIFSASLKGLAQAQGRYVHFFSSDDMMLAGFLSQVMALFEKEPRLNLACSEITYFSQDKPLSSLKPSIEPSLILTPEKTMALLQATKLSIPGLACITKREMFEKYGFLNPSLENISDWFFFHRIALFEGLGFVPQKLIAMREHGGTYTSQVKRSKKRRRAVYTYLLKSLMKRENRQSLVRFAKARLLDFIFKEKYYRLLCNPFYAPYWPYLIKLKK